MCLHMACAAALLRAFWYEDEEYELTPERRREIREMGFPDDGYDYLKHLRDMGRGKGTAPARKGLREVRPLPCPALCTCLSTRFAACTNARSLPARVPLGPREGHEPHNANM